MRRLDLDGKDESSLQFLCRLHPQKGALHLHCWQATISMRRESLKMVLNQTKEKSF